MTRSRCRRMTYRDLEYLRRRIREAPIDLSANGCATADEAAEDEIEINDQQRKETK